MKFPQLHIRALLGMILGSASLATVDVVLDSFETLPLIDPTPANPPYTSVSQSTTAATDGTYSLKIDFDNSSTWSWLYTADSAGSHNWSPSAYAKWYTHKTMKMDVHRPALDFSPAATGWNLEIVVANNGAMGWSQKQLLNWVWLNNGVSSTETLTWDYSAIRDTAPLTSSYFQLALLARGGNGGTVYIDNVRFADPVDIGFTFPTNSTGGDLQGWGSQSWGTAGAAGYWEPEDVNGSDASGSLYAYCDFSTETTNQTAVFQVWNLGIDTLEYGKIGFDVKVDSSTSTLTSDGDYGSVEIVARIGSSGTFTPLESFVVPASAGSSFIHYEVPVAAEFTNILGLNLIFASTNFNGPVNYYVDNIMFLARTQTEPPAVVMTPAGPGLEINGCAPDPVGQRQSVRTISGDYNWASASGPVTYSMDINQGLPAEAAGMDVYMFLIGTTNSAPGVYPDWDEENGIFLTLRQQASGLCNASLNFKTNAPADHGPRYTAAGTLATLASVPMAGNWQLTFNGAAVTLSSPDGAVTNSALPADALSLFTTNVFVYYGVQPQLNENRNQYISLGGVKITGAAASLNEDFTTQSSLPASLVGAATSPGGIQMRPPSTVYRLSWSAPSPGFFLESAASLTGDWTSAGLPVNLEGERNVTFIPSASLPSTDAGFFRLHQP